MTARPARLQLSRAKGFKLSEASASENDLPHKRVDRCTKWGNPFGDEKVFIRIDGHWTTTEHLLDAASIFGLWLRGKAQGPAIVSLYPRRKWMLEHLEELRGKNLACWCKPFAPCHADVLLEIANA